MSWLFRVMIGVLTVTIASTQVQSAEPQPNYAEQILKIYSVPLTDTGLREYLRKESPKLPDPSVLAKWTEQLGVADFHEREKATKQLIAAGPAVISFLQALPPTPDPEAAERRNHVISAIAGHWSPKRVSPYRAAIRELMHRRATDLTPLFVELLPTVEGDQVLDDMWFALDSFVVESKKVDKLYEDVAKDSWADRRAIAGFMLARRGNAQQQLLAKSLLTDKEVMVRLRTAQGFLGTGDLSVVPVLIELLTQKPVVMAWQAEELLSWLAGDDSPEAIVAEGGELAKKAQSAWREWWKKVEGNLDFKAICREPRRPMLLMVQTQVLGTYICGSNGRQRWSDSHHRSPIQQIVAINPDDSAMCTVVDEVEMKNHLERKFNISLVVTSLSGELKSRIGRVLSDRDKFDSRNGIPVYSQRWLCGKTLVVAGRTIGIVDSRKKDIARLDVDQTSPFVNLLDQHITFSPSWSKCRLIDSGGGITLHANREGVPWSVTIEAASGRLLASRPDQEWSTISVEVNNGTEKSWIHSEVGRRKRIVEKSNDKIVWECPCHANDAKASVFAGLVRAGFDDSIAQRIDLNTNLEYRRKELNHSDYKRRSMAVRSILEDFSDRLPVILEDLLKTTGRELTVYRRIDDPADVRIFYAPLSTLWHLHEIKGIEQMVLPYCDESAVQSEYTVVGARYILRSKAFSGATDEQYLRLAIDGSRSRSSLIRGVSYWMLAHVGTDQSDTVLPILLKGLKDNESWPIWYRGERRDMAASRPSTCAAEAISLYKGSYKNSDWKQIADALLDIIFRGDDCMSKACSRTICDLYRDNREALDYIVPLCAEIYSHSNRVNTRLYALTILCRPNSYCPLDDKAIDMLADHLVRPATSEQERIAILGALACQGKRARAALPQIASLIEVNASEESRSRIVMALRAIGVPKESQHRAMIIQNIYKLNDESMIFDLGRILTDR